IHPAVTLLNAALIERTGGDFMFYEEGVTEAVGRLMKAVDGERLSVARALGVEILAEPDLGVRQGYMSESNYSTGYSTAPGFRGIKAQDELHHRYLTEDVGYSMVFLADLARHLSVPTPPKDAVIRIASIVAGEDFANERARTMDKMGLSGLTREQLAVY
ncbi:MAG: NAD/NADP octopine/nopaline dehydrogenase family protein, partial [Actinomycetota bacterium]